MSWEWFVSLVLAYVAGHAFGSSRTRRKRKYCLPFFWECPIGKCKFKIEASNKSTYLQFIDYHIDYHRRKNNDGVSEETEA